MSKSSLTMMTTTTTGSGVVIQTNGSSGMKDDHYNDDDDHDDDLSNNNNTTSPLGTSLENAIHILSTNPIKSLQLLTQLQKRVVSNDIVSTTNECIDDVTTSVLPLLSIEYHMAMAYLQLPTTTTTTTATTAGGGDGGNNNMNNGSTSAATSSNSSSTTSSSSEKRRNNVKHANELFHGFLRMMDQLGVWDDDGGGDGRGGGGGGGGGTGGGTGGGIDEDLGKELKKEYEKLLQLEHNHDDDTSTAGDPQRPLPPRRRPTSSSEPREVKIARFRRKKQLQQMTTHLQAQKQRRYRLDISPDETVDGYDMEGLDRCVSLLQLRQYSLEAMEEINQGTKELDMLDIAVSMERRRLDGERHRGSGSGSGPHPHDQRGGGGPPPTQGGGGQQSSSAMKVTHVTKDALTGNLLFRREQLKQQVFQPGWNLPTMSLEEFANKEYNDAIQRGERQKISEKEALKQPRRYEQLVKDGMEDDHDLVDKSAELDRKWDEFKDDNPRGCGNKMGDRGDRNF